MKYKRKIKRIEIHEVALSDVPDGVYEGDCDAYMVAAKTRVTVKEGAFAKIELLSHKNERGKSGEAVIDRVMEAQSLEVDVISGATSSSKVILKSIETALEGNADK